MSFKPMKGAPVPAFSRSIWMLSLFSVRSSVSISATSWAVCRPTDRPVMETSKLPFVVPLRVTVCAFCCTPSTYRLTVFVPVPLTA